MNDQPTTAPIDYLRHAGWSVEGGDIPGLYRINGGPEITFNELAGFARELAACAAWRAKRHQPPPDQMTDTPRYMYRHVQFNHMTITPGELLAELGDSQWELVSIVAYTQYDSVLVLRSAE